MKIVKIDDKGRSACETCGAFRSTTYKLRDVPLSDNSDTVKDILVGVCDYCDEVTDIPHQSTPMIKQVFNKKRRSVEVRTPAHMVDILNFASYKVGGDTSFAPQLLKYYLHALSKDDISIEGIDNYLSSELAEGKADKRISIKGRYIVEDIEEFKRITHIKSTSNVIKSVVLKINDDILVKQKQEQIFQIGNIVAAVS